MDIYWLKTHNSWFKSICGLSALSSIQYSTIFYLYLPSMGTVEVQTAFHAKDLSCSIKWKIPVIQVQIKNVVLCSTNLRSLCFTWAVWTGHGRLEQLCTSNLKYTQKYSGWTQSYTSWDGFSWNKNTIITTSLGFLISPSMICRTSRWTIGACPFLSLQRRPVQPTDRVAVYVDAIGSSTIQLKL